MTVTESVFITSLQNGDQQAFSRLIQLNQDRVFNTVLGFVKNADEANDLCQEVFIQVFRSIGSFKGEAGLSTWIYRIAVNKALEHIRKQKKKRQTRWQLFSSGSENMVEKVPDPVHPGLILEDQERSKQLFKAIDRLAERQKTALILYQFEDLSYKEIAQVMELSLASVESLIHRARRNLKKHLTDYYEKY
ncbi:MAG: sigma-70 family RNA polymerase sigma factor [Bacteroidota bacterium]